MVLFDRQLPKDVATDSSPEGESGPRACYARLPRRCRAPAWCLLNSDQSHATQQIDISSITAQ